MKRILVSTWLATTLVVATWPIMLRVQRRLWNKRGLAVAVMTLALLSALVVGVAPPFRHCDGHDFAIAAAAHRSNLRGAPTGFYRLYR